jgi:hypothetical protein
MELVTFTVLVNDNFKKERFISTTTTTTTTMTTTPTTTTTTTTIICTTINTTAVAAYVKFTILIQSNSIHSHLTKDLQVL